MTDECIIYIYIFRLSKPNCESESSPVAMHCSNVVSSFEFKAPLWNVQKTFNRLKNLDLPRQI